MHFGCHEHRVLGHWFATCDSPAGSVGRNLEEGVQKPSVGCGRNYWLPGKVTHLHADTPCCRVPGFSRCIHTTPIAVRYGESGDSVASGRDSTATECVCVLSGPATVITNIAAVSALLADGWSTESLSRVVRITRTRRENHERGTHRTRVFHSHTRRNGGKHPAENTIPEDDQEDETEQSLSDSNRNLCSRIFAEKIESDGNRREVTSLEAPWRSDKTERAGRDCKEDYYKMTQNGSEASTRKVFLRGPRRREPSQGVKSQRQRVQCAPTCFRQESSSDERCCFGVWRSRPRRSKPAADRRICKGTVDEYETHRPTGKPGIGSQTSMETSPAHAAKHYKGELHLGQQPLWFWRRGWSERSKKTNRRILAPGCSNQQHVDHGLDCIPWFRSQVFTIPGTTVY